MVDQTKQDSNIIVIDCWLGHLGLSIPLHVKWKIYISFGVIVGLQVNGVLCTVISEKNCEVLFKILVI